MYLQLRILKLPKVSQMSRFKPYSLVVRKMSVLWHVPNEKAKGCRKNDLAFGKQKDESQITNQNT